MKKLITLFGVILLSVKLNSQTCVKVDSIYTTSKFEKLNSRDIRFGIKQMAEEELQDKFLTAVLKIMQDAGIDITTMPPKLPDVCPTKEVLDKIIEIRNKLVTDLNNLKKTLNIVAGTVTTATTIFEVASKLPQIIGGVKTALSLGIKFIPSPPGAPGAVTSALSDLEDLAYRRMIDLYYQNEGPFHQSLDIARKIRSTQQIVDQLLPEFFEWDEEIKCWKNKRCDDEIAKYHDRLEQASRAGKASAERRSNSRSTTVQPTKNQEPITKNQIKIKQLKLLALLMLIFKFGMIGCNSGKLRRPLSQKLSSEVLGLRLPRLVGH